MASTVLYPASTNFLTSPAPIPCCSKALMGNGPKLSLSSPAVVVVVVVVVVAPVDSAATTEDDADCIVVINGTGD